METALHGHAKTFDLRSDFPFNNYNRPSGGVKLMICKEYLPSRGLVFETGNFNEFLLASVLKIALNN